MLHRVDDPLAELDSARFFRMASRLPLRDGAVRAALIQQLRTEQEIAAADTAAATPAPAPPSLSPSAATASAPGARPGARVAHVDDPRVLAAMTQNRQGFPSVAYKGGR